MDKKAPTKKHRPNAPKHPVCNCRSQELEQALRPYLEDHLKAELDEANQQVENAEWSLEQANDRLLEMNNRLREWQRVFFEARVEIAMLREDRAIDISMAPITDESDEE